MAWTPRLLAPLKLAFAVACAAIFFLTGTVRPLVPVAGQAATRTVHTQDVWLFSDFTLADAAGTRTDITPQLLAAANAAPGTTVDLGGLSYTDAPALSGMAWDGSGTPLATVSLHFGVVSTPAGQVFTAFASPDITQSQVSLDPSSSVGLDLSGVSGIPAATGGTVSYLFQQMLTPLDPANETGLDEVAILAQRWRQRNFQQLGAADGSGKLQTGIVIDAPLTIGRSSSSGESGLARYLQATSLTSWQKFGAASVRAVGQVTSSIGQLFGGGTGPVSAQQAAQDNDPQALGPCDPDCTIELTGRGVSAPLTAPYIQGGLQQMEQQVEIKLSGRVGTSTGGKIQALSQQTIVTFIRHNQSTNCQLVASADDPSFISSFTFTTSNAFMTGQLSHSQLRIGIDTTNVPNRNIFCRTPVGEGGVLQIRGPVDELAGFNPSTTLELDLVYGVTGDPRPVILNTSNTYEVHAPTTNATMTVEVTLTANR